MSEVERLRALLAECWEWIEGEYAGTDAPDVKDLAIRVDAALRSHTEATESP